MFDTRMGAQIRYEPGSCGTSNEGFAELQVFWHAKVLEAEAVTNALFRLGEPGPLGLDWFSLGVKNYEAMFAEGPKTSLPSWMLDHSTKLEALYESLKSSFKVGPLFLALNGTSTETKILALSLLRSSLEEREAVAYSRFGQMGQDASYMWMVIRHLFETLEEATPGMRPEGIREKITMVPINPEPVTGRRLLQTKRLPSMGMIQVPVADQKGVYRNLVCGTGIFGDTLERAARMAINGWEYGSYCNAWSAEDGPTDTQVTFTKFSNDAEMSQQLSVDIELQLTKVGTSIGGGVKFVMDTMSSNSAVFIMQKANKLKQPPLALPPQAPNLTPTALKMLRDRGEAAFEEVYGTHFIVGFRLGGYLIFYYKFQSNEQVSKMDINANLNINAKKADVDLSAEFKKKSEFTSVDITKTVRTNTRLPIGAEEDPDSACAKIGVGTDFDAALLEKCEHP
ncbi:MAG: hypothetical protein J3K34DRAFT_500054 [Monoraphidium minutum]|nr:MAG: hypothetical protein J3K34DRAFT_500054 [Monoraphidium minutum]